MTALGTLVVGGHDFVVTAVELRGSAFVIVAHDDQRRAYTLHESDTYTLFGADGGGVCQGGFGMGPLRKAKGDQLQITVAMRVDHVNKGQRNMHGVAQS